MATGAGTGGAIKIALTLVALVAMFRHRRKPKGPTEADEEFKARQAAKMEMERRLAAYLASRDSGYQAGDDEHREVK
jgi:hypothetical protein